jgi:hypothetical protein
MHKGHVHRVSSDEALKLSFIRIKHYFKNWLTMYYTPSMTAATLSSTAFTLSSIVCVTFRTCAVAIRASSCVSLSNLFNASSISVLPTSFLRYFSENISVNGDRFAPQTLTRSALPDLFRCNRKNAENLDHYRCNCIHHFFVRRYRHVDFETSEKGFYAFENVNESVLAGLNIFCCL